MYAKNHPSFITLLLLISFASVNAVLFTPALPSIAHYFEVTNNTAQQTITVFLIGYAMGQLFYGPLANRFGRKVALFIGITLQIFSSLLCAFSGLLHIYSILVLGRFLLALGSSVGLKMTFTLINEYYKPQIASQKTSYLLLAFAIVPGLSVALGGMLNTHYGWASCFYVSAIYGLTLLLLVSHLPETMHQIDLNALKLKYLFQGYSSQLKSFPLIAGGLLMGCCTCFIYIFAAGAPFIAMNLFGMNSQEYGNANLLPAIGMVAGSLLSAQMAKNYSQDKIIQVGLLVVIVAIAFMMVVTLTSNGVWIALFIPMLLVYLGLSLIIANASTLAMSQSTDKAHASAMMNFLNMGLTTLVVLGLGMFSISKLLLPVIYTGLALFMIALFYWIRGEPG